MDAQPAKSPIDGVDDATWLEVIHKMDEVYSKLVADEVALEEQNEQLEQSQRFVYGLLTAMSDVLIACDEHGLIEQTNDALCELVGRTGFALRGCPMFELMTDKAAAERLQVALTSVLRGGTSLEIELTDATNQPVPVEMNVTPRFDTAQRQIGYLFVGRPIGEIKRAYHQLRQTHEALKHAQQQLLHAEKLTSLGRLVAGVAHELNNPISFVLGNVDALTRYSERLREYLAAIHEGRPGQEQAALRHRLRIDRALADLPSLLQGMQEGAQRTADIVHGLKRFSAMDREERSPVELASVVERAIHWVKKGTAPAFDVRWEPGRPCRVLASAGQLLQVMMNLVQNAYDAAAAYGDATPTLWITQQREGDRVRLFFRDNGTGILEQHLSRLFDPFFTTKPVGKGTGLGLSISYGIVEQHGGALIAANHPGGGAVFTLELPALPD